jgi:hypothetical protein
MVIETSSNTSSGAALLVDIKPGNFAYWDADNKEGAFKDWSELSLGVQERLQQIQAEVDNLVNEARGLMGRTDEYTHPQRSLF